MAKPTRREPPNPTIEAWAHGLPNEYLLCRDIGHSWRPFTASFDESMNAYTRVLRCGRCRTERVQSLSMYGHAVSGGYRYAEGYAAPKGTGHLVGVDRDAVRLESIVRLVNPDVAEEAPARPVARIRRRAS